MDWDRVRKYGNYGAVGAAVLAWGVAFKFGWGNSEWTGFWGQAQETRGNAVVIKEKRVETTAERAARLGKQNSDLDNAIRDLRKDLLGDNRPTAGVAPKFRPRIPKDIASYTQRDACFQMKLEFPDRFGDVDCMSDKYDDNDPWFKAPTRPGQ